MLDDLDTSNLRDRAVANAVSLLGLGYFEPGKKDEYKARIWPFDPPGVSEGMAKTESSCGLTVEEEDRMLGVDDFGLGMYGPYAPRSRGEKGTLYALELTVEVAKKAGAWVDCTSWDPSKGLPLRADHVVIGNNENVPSWVRGASAYQHIFSPEYDVGPDMICRSIDGGQPGIARVVRIFVPVAGQLWVAKASMNAGGVVTGTGIDPQGFPYHGKRVLGFVDLGRMQFLAA